MPFPCALNLTKHNLKGKKNKKNRHSYPYLTEKCNTVSGGNGHYLGQESSNENGSILEHSVGCCTLQKQGLAIGQKNNI